MLKERLSSPRELEMPAGAVKRTPREGSLAGFHRDEWPFMCGLNGGVFIHCAPGITALNCLECLSGGSSKAS